MNKTTGYEFTVYVKFPSEGDDWLRIDEIINAGAKALGIDAVCEETDFKDTYED